MPVGGYKVIFERKYRLKVAGPPAGQAPGHPGNPRTLAFVNVAHPEQVKDPLTQRKIRRHVVLTSKQPRRRASDSVDVGPCRDVARPQPQLPTPSYWGEVRICTHFNRLFQAMDMVSKGLISIAVNNLAHKSGPRLYEGLHDLQRQNELGKRAPLAELKQYTDSVSLVRSSILPRRECLAGRYATVGTVVCLAYFEVRARRNYAGWAMHMQGLETIVKLYGGVDTLDSHQATRQALFLTDVLGSLTYDARPRFAQIRDNSMPWNGSAGSSLHAPLKSKTGAASRSDGASSVVIDSALRSISQLAALINNMPGKYEHEMAFDLLIPVCRISHDLLSLPRRSEDVLLPSPLNTPLSAITELVRISALALVATVISTTSGDDLYCTAYRSGAWQDILRRTEREDWDGREELRLWVLVVQSTMDLGPVRAWLVDEIMDAMGSLSLRTWDELVSCLHQVGWVRHLAMQEMERLRLNVEARLVRESDVV